MNYDLAGRLASKDYRTLANSPAGTIADSDSFTYDKAGRMLTAVSGRYTNTVTFTFDAAGRKNTESLTISGQTYTTTTAYNAKGELTSYTYPDGTAVGRSYTDRGELYQISHAGTTIDTRVYDDGGRMTSSTYNNGVSESRAYNTDNTLASISFSGASIGNLTYGWDLNKNKTSEAIAGTMSNYGFTVPTGGYDSEDRLVGFNRTSGLTQSWSLSEVGDWDSVTTNGTTETRTHGPTHELLTAGGNSVSTDTKGNITLIPAALRPNASSLLMNWDFDNRLNTADVGNNSSIDVTYKFDAMGRRVFRDDGTTAMVYVQSGQQTIADYTASSAPSSPIYRYVYASYIDEPVLRFKLSGSESLYYHRNQQYSVVALTDGSAAIVERYAYSAYGVPTITNASGTVLTLGSVDNRYMYTGREWDQALSLYHYRARMYDANLGRFASRDPIDYLGSKWNMYQYVSGRILARIDPFGLLDSTTKPSTCPSTASQGPVKPGNVRPSKGNIYWIAFEFGRALGEGIDDLGEISKGCMEYDCEEHLKKINNTLPGRRSPNVKPFHRYNPQYVPRTNPTNPGSTGNGRCFLFSAMSPVEGGKCWQCTYMCPQGHVPFPIVRWQRNGCHSDSDVVEGWPDKPIGPKFPEHAEKDEDKREGHDWCEGSEDGSPMPGGGVWK